MHDCCSAYDVVPYRSQILNLWRVFMAIHESFFAKNAAGCAQMKFFSHWVVIATIMFGALFEDW